nr:MAG: ORF2 [Giant panda anellovirus]
MSTKEQLWIHSIIVNHQLFCSCNKPKEHLRRIWPGYEEDGAAGGDPITDAELGDIAVTFDLKPPEDTTVEEDTHG